LGLNAGLDFETRIFLKEDAPELFREFLARKGWEPQPLAMSVLTDCYQPAERDYQLARGCLEVALEFRQPMSILTKNALIMRDRDVLRTMAAEKLVHVTFSVATLDAELTRAMEPHTSAPAERLQAIRSLTDEGVPVRALVAPIISGLNDSEIPALLAALKVAGAQAAAHTMLRLPPVVEPLFLGWLEQAQPGRLRRIEGRLRAASSSSPGEPGHRETGATTGTAADSAKPVADLFRIFASRYRLDGPLPALECSGFRRPRAKSGQLLLF
jgi:DNA repair photolyase